MDMLGLSAIAGAFLLLAHGAVKGREHRRAFLFVFFGLLAFGLAGRFFNGNGLIDTSIFLLRDFGLGLVLGSAYLAVRANKPKVFLVPGVLALTLSGALFCTVRSVEWAVDKATGKQIPVKGEFLLELGPDDQLSEVQDILTKYKARAERAFPSVTLAEDENLAQYFIIKAADEKLAALMEALKADKENVDQVDFNYEISLSPNETSEVSAQAGPFLTNDPRVKDQWGFAKTDGDALHKKLKKLEPKRKAIVAIVDTGVDAQHEDIRSVWDASSGDRDGNGHGTHCAGIAGASTNNGIGVASYNWANRFIKIRGYKALSDRGSGTLESVCQAIIDAAKDGADIISLSLGAYSPTPPKMEVDAINFAIRKGCIIVAAAGNSNDDAKKHSPANIPGVICVSALDQNMNKAKFSNTNNNVQYPIAAPGVAILSLKTGGGYVAYSGTSMATPMVAGLLGLMRSMKPKLNTKQAYKILHETGMQLSDSSRVGHGINAVQTLDRVSQ